MASRSPRGLLRLAVVPALICAVAVTSAPPPAGAAGKAPVTIDTATSHDFFEPASMKTFLDMLDCLFSTNCHVLSGAIHDNTAQWTFSSAGGPVSGTVHFVYQSLFTVDAKNSQHETYTIQCPLTLTLDMQFTGSFDGHSTMSGIETGSASGGAGGYCGRFGGKARPSAWHAVITGTAITGRLADQGVNLPFQLRVTATTPVGPTTTVAKGPSDLRSRLNNVVGELFSSHALGSLFRSGTDCGSGAGPPGPLCQQALSASTDAANFLAAQYGQATTALDKRMANLWSAVAFAGSIKDKNGQSGDAATIGAALTIANFLNPAELSSRHHTRAEPAQDGRNIAACENFLIILDAIQPSEANPYQWGG
ncbi:MAG: hypothetical protein ACHQFZ_10375 [Acidimicrobiales bacterium]